MKKDAITINKKDLQEFLNSIVTKALGGPHGDPEDCNMEIAAMCYLFMKKFKLDTTELEEPNEGDGESGHQSTLDFLKGENIYEQDFTKNIKWNGEYIR